MALQNPLTGWNIGYSFTPTLNDNNLLSADPANTGKVAWAWVVPLTTGTLVGLDLQGLALSVVFTAKDLNLVFPVPFSRFKATGTTGTYIAVFPA